VADKPPLPAVSQHLPQELQFLIAPYLNDLGKAV
jgi:hypothetical protein